MLMMKEDGLQIGRFKVRKLMREMNLISKQPGFHAYKKATVERRDLTNVLNREFSVACPNLVWCGDITYIWAEGRWHYLAAVIDISFVYGDAAIIKEIARALGASVEGDEGEAY
jgi:putative transposase